MLNATALGFGATAKSVPFTSADARPRAPHQPPANRLIAFNPFYLPLCATIKFSNNDKYVCGKPIYDHENDNVNVYLDLQLLPGFSEVKAGDIRLNKVVC